MTKTTILRIAAALMMFAATSGASAITITIDNPNQTVALPTTGFAVVDFTGTVALSGSETYIATESLGGATCLPVNVDCLFDYTFGSGPNPFTTNVDTLLFSIIVPSSTQLGFHSGGLFAASACGRLTCGGSVVADYSINVVESSSVPEPATLGLLGLGMAGLAFMRKRKVTN